MEVREKGGVTTVCQVNLRLPMRPKAQVNLTPLMRTHTHTHTLLKTKLLSLEFFSVAERRAAP